MKLPKQFWVLRYDDGDIMTDAHGPALFPTKREAQIEARDSIRAFSRNSDIPKPVRVQLVEVTP
jgi:hypothetical protein